MARTWCRPKGLACVLQTAAASKFAGDLLDTLLATHLSQQQAQHLLNATALLHTPPQTVVFFVGRQVSMWLVNFMFLQVACMMLIPVLRHGQVSTQDLGDPSAADAMRPLRAAVEAAGSSLSLPYVLHKVSRAMVPACTLSDDGRCIRALVRSMPLPKDKPLHACRAGRA